MKNGSVDHPRFEFTHAAGEDSALVKLPNMLWPGGRKCCHEKWSGGVGRGDRSDKREIGEELGPTCSISVNPLVLKL